MIGRATVLLIDSQAGERRELAAYLRANDFDAFEAEDGAGSLRQFFSLHPDLVVVDLDVMGMSGWDVIARVRELSDTPVVVIASAATNEHVSRAFQLGVDGFLARPFEPKELLVRLAALRDRDRPSSDKRWVYRRNGLTVDLRSCDVRVHGEPVALTGTEYRLLTYLIERRGWVLSHDQILTHVWGPDYMGERDQVKLYVWYLRRKIENDPKDPQMIVTRRGLGYTFVG
jgi:two-component system KDP operon response regulator KdpE